MNAPNYKVGHVGLHCYEEPFISGKKGSGTIFLSGCNMHCVYCQNYVLSQQKEGRVVSQTEFIAMAVDLAGQGAHNINRVSPSHYIKALAQTLPLLKKEIAIPIVYNTSSYDSADDLKRLNGLVDIYLADVKYVSSDLSALYSATPDYFEVCSRAVKEMKRQQPADVIDADGMLLKGVVIRHLVLPTLTEDGKRALDFVANELGNKTLVSLMAQYVPLNNPPYPLNRRITRSEYRRLVEYAEALGLDNVLTQDFTSASEEYVPHFNLI